MSTKYKFWLTGIVLAVIGVVTARVLAPAFAPAPEQALTQFIIFVIGVTISLAGLGLIMAGLKKN